MKKMSLIPVIGAIALASLATAFSYVGCGGSSSGSSAPVDTTAPTVVSKGPATNATNVALNAVITATFSEAMDPATITNTTFTLYDSGNDIDVAGTVAYDAASKTATLTPTANLVLAGRYTARLTTGVKDSAGNAMTYFAWTFNTRDGAWGTDLRIDTSDVNDADGSHVAMGPNGNGIAVWAEVTNTQYSILASRYVSGTGWTAPVLLETDNANLALNPKMAMDSAGNAICVWKQISGSYYSVFANRYTSGGSWGVAEAIQPAGSGDSAVPQISMAVSGNAICVWQQSNGTTNSIWANAYISGTGWAGVELLETDDGEALNPQIAVDPSGNAIAVWQQVTPSVSSSILANHYISGTGWAGAVIIDSESNNAVNPQVAVGSSGSKTIAVWQQISGTISSIFANRFLSGTGWASAVLLETNETGDATVPQIAMDTEGFGMAVWQHYDLGANQRSIYAAYFNTEGNTWGAPALLESGSNHAYAPRIAFDRDQRAIAIWSQSDGIVNNIYVNRYIYGIGWGTAGLVEATALNARDASCYIAFDLLGNAMAVWRHNGGSIDHIRANRFVFE